jgi:hypothetical protein
MAAHSADDEDEDMYESKEDSIFFEDNDDEDRDNGNTDYDGADDEDTEDEDTNEDDLSSALVPFKNRRRTSSQSQLAGQIFARRRTSNDYSDCPYCGEFEVKDGVCLNCETSMPVCVNYDCRSYNVNLATGSYKECGGNIFDESGSFVPKTCVCQDPQFMLGMCVQCGCPKKGFVNECREHKEVYGICKACGAFVEKAGVAEEEGGDMEGVE